MEALQERCQELELELRMVSAQLTSLQRKYMVLLRDKRDLSYMKHQIAHELGVALKRDQSPQTSDSEEDYDTVDSANQQPEF